MMNIVITGASSGIGAALATSLASEHRILAIARSAKALEELAALHSNIVAFPADISKLTESQFSSCLNSAGWTNVDVLVNNAGLLINKPFLNLTDADWQEVYQTNVLAVAHLIRLTFPYLKKSKSPHIVNISSMGGVQGSIKFPGLSAYSSSKGALTILTECLAEEFKEENIRVNTLALGSVQTPMLAKAFPGYQASLNPAEMAKMISWFVTEGSGFFNGKTIPVASETP